MRFGGHQTFSIRDGWLYKGLKFLKEDPDLLTDEHAADWLGVGRNMAKSINHWLLATGLAEGVYRGGGRNTKLELTEFGEVICENDPYFLHASTWWAVHINLVAAKDHAASWNWFFNRFSLPRFDRAVCLEGLKRYLAMSGGRTPSINTLRRDVACLLGSYAAELPPERVDPEEARECPLVELGLVRYFKASGHYEVERGPKAVPSEIVGYAVAAAMADELQDDVFTITLPDLLRVENGPTKVFLLTSEALMEILDRQAAPETWEIISLGSEKALRLPARSALDWLRRAYSRQTEGRHVA